MAAIIRISSSISLFEPRRSRVRSCKIRNSFICACMGIDSISSRNKVPPWAYSNLPIRLPDAPEKAPFSWPNNSLSMRFSGTAPQLMATKLWVRRLLCSCSERATSSLPVPVSPNNRISAGVSAIWAIISRNSTIALVVPMIRGPSVSFACRAFFKVLFSSVNMRFSIARFTDSVSRTEANGFSIKS